MMTLEEIKQLQTGDRVRVTWFGGNGPHVYTIKRNNVGDILACVDGLPNGYPGVLFDALRDHRAKFSIHQVERLEAI
jgi:hypothetical protein